MSVLPVYTLPGTTLGGQSFNLENAVFGEGDPDPGLREAVYDQYQVVTVYVLPFMLSAEAGGRCCIFLPPRDYNRPWLIGDELRAGQRVSEGAAFYVEAQAAVPVPLLRRRQFMWIDNVELQRHITVERNGKTGIVVRHELARVVGFAITPEEMADFKLIGLDPQATGEAHDYWIDIMSSDGQAAMNDLDPALEHVIKMFRRRLADFLSGTR